MREGCKEQCIHITYSKPPPFLTQKECLENKELDNNDDTATVIEDEIMEQSGY